MTDAADKRQAELLALRSRLQLRVLESQPEFDDVTAGEVWRGIKRFLTFAYDDGLLDTPPEKIHEFVPKPTSKDNMIMITGGLVDGSKPFKRKSDDIRIQRSDGAWLHFTITFEGKKKIQSLWAYDFELVFPEGNSPAFVRFDLNEPAHTNEDREIRSHMHPGDDDLLLPAPVMTPEELLDVLVRRLRNNRDDAKPRS